jgi:hypothetical protein
MCVRLLFFLPTVFVLAGASSIALSQSNVPTGSFTLQVASFPSKELADKFMIGLVSAGEHPTCATVALQGRGTWTRVFVGLFTRGESARQYGENLIARGLIAEFLVRRAELDQDATRPRRVSRPDGQPASVANRTAGSDNAGEGVGQPARRVENSAGKCTPGARADCPEMPLPVLAATSLGRTPTPRFEAVPRPNPVRLAMRLVTGASGPGIHAQGGFWLSGNTAEGLARLGWIAGEGNSDMIRVEPDGRVRIDEEMLASAAGIECSQVEDPLRAAGFITSNEGLLLLVQLTHARHRYRLHIGSQAPTYGKPLEVTSSVNLDNNYDSRINPFRRQGKKMDNERPPEGFDSLVALNPVARWYNLTNKEWVPAGEVTFHELAEAYAKVEMGLDYLPHGTLAGAHAVALERERLMKSQRPGEDIVVTTGSNRVLRSLEEIRLFFADNPSGTSQR